MISKVIKTEQWMDKFSIKWTSNENNIHQKANSPTTERDFVNGNKECGKPLNLQTPANQNTDE